MTMISAGKAPPAGAARQSAPRPAGDPRASSDKRFAGMLGRMDLSPPLTFRRSPGQSGEAVSFAAMPLVAPVSLAVNAAAHDGLENLPAAAAAGAHADVTDHRSRDEPPGEPSLDRPHYEPAHAATSTAAGHGRGGAASPVAPGVAETEPALLPVASRAIRGERIGGSATGRSNPADGTPAKIPLMLDLGSGITVHLAGDADNRRIWVRGANIEVEGRGDIKARIVRLMRSHGVVISEQSIEFDRGRNT